MDSNYMQMHGSLDRVRNGFNLEDSGAPKHPLQNHLKSQSLGQYNDKVNMIRCSYGTHMAMKLISEESFLKQGGRLPGLMSSKIHADTLSATDSNIDFSDFFGASENSPYTLKQSLHSLVEKKFQIL